MGLSGFDYTCLELCFLELMGFPDVLVFESSFDYTHRTVEFWSKTLWFWQNSFLMLFWSNHAWKIYSGWRKMTNRGILLCIVLWLLMSRLNFGCRGQRFQTSAPGLDFLLGASVATGSSAAAEWLAISGSKPVAWHDRWRYHLAWQERRLLSFSGLDFDSCNSSIISECHYTGNMISPPTKTAAMLDLATSLLKLHWYQE